MISVWNAFAESFNHVIGVHGNHSIVENELLNSNINTLDEYLIDYAGIVVSGIGGIIGPADRNQRKTKEHFGKALKAVSNKKSVITLLHQGPDDPINDQFSQL